MAQSYDFQLNYGSGFVSVDPPQNWKGLVIKILFIDQRPNASLSGLNFIWHGKNATNLNNYWNAGLSGGNGIGEGVGIRIYTCSSTPVLFFDGYIDLADAKALIQCDEVSAPCVETGKIDWLNKICAAISFNFLATPTSSLGAGILSLNDCKLTPYCIHTDRDYLKEALIAAETFTLLREGYEAARKTIEYVELMLGLTTSSLVPPFAATPTLLAEILGIIQYVIELGLIIVSLVTLFKQLIDSFFQLRKYKACMTYEKHFEKICQYFGMNFSSTILQGGTYMNDTWMPAKNYIPDLSNPLNVFKRPYDESQNFPNNTAVVGWWQGNCSDFIRFCCDKFNAEINIIVNPNTGISTLYFEEKHFWNNVSSFHIPNTGENGNTRNLPQPNGSNHSELPPNYLVEFATDQSDTNTIKRYDGTTCEISVQPNSIYNIKNVCVGNPVWIKLECALAKRKDYLAKYEELINSVLNGLTNFVNSVIGFINHIINGINTVISLFGGNSTAIPTIPTYPTNLYALTRLGWMTISDDVFNIPKSFIGKQVGNDWQIDPNNATNMSANALMQNFHGKNLATRGNQQLTFKNKTFKFCCVDFVSLSQRNVITSPDGRLGKMVSFDWDVYNERAINVEYRIFANFTNNIHEVTTVDGIIQ